MGLTKPIEQVFIKLLRYIYVSKRYYTRREHIMKKNLLTKMKKAVAMVMAACLLFGWMGHGASDAGVAPYSDVAIDQGFMN